MVEDIGPLASTIASVTWTVDYERNGLSRNSYFPPEVTRVNAKFNIYQSRNGIVVPVLKVSAVFGLCVQLSVIIYIHLLL